MKILWKVSETPPPSYEEALYRNSVRLPGLQVFYTSLSPLFLSLVYIFLLFSLSSFSRFLLFPLCQVPDILTVPPSSFSSSLIHPRIFKLSDGEPAKQSRGCDDGGHIFTSLAAAHPPTNFNFNFNVNCNCNCNPFLISCRSNPPQSTPGLHLFLVIRQTYGLPPFWLEGFFLCICNTHAKYQHCWFKIWIAKEDARL